MLPYTYILRFGGPRGSGRPSKKKKIGSCTNHVPTDGIDVGLSLMVSNRTNRSDSLAPSQKPVLFQVIIMISSNIVITNIITTIITDDEPQRGTKYIP